MYPLTLGSVIGTKSLWDELQACIRELPVRVLLEQKGFGPWDEFVDKLEKTTPDLLIIDLAEVNEPLEVVIGRIKAVPNPPTVAVLHTEATPDLILDSMRAGANEFLYSPLQSSLPKALARLSSEREQKKRPSSRAGRALGFLSVKGGCGATTLACHTALELARQTNQPTLLADLDIDAGMLGFLMKSQSEYSISDALRNIHRLDLSFWKKLVSNGTPNLELIAAPSALNAGADITPENVRAVTAFTRSHYNWTVLDLGRGLSRTTLTALENVDQAFLVTTMEVPALHQAKQIIQRLLDSGFPRENLRLLMNRMPRHPDLTLQEIEKALGHDIYGTVPNDYQSLYESYSEGRLLDENTAVRRYLAQVVRKIAGLEEPRTKKKFSLFG